MLWLNANRSDKQVANILLTVTNDRFSERSRFASPNEGTF
jgi:hypothetical protein